MQLSLASHHNHVPQSQAQKDPVTAPVHLPPASHHFPNNFLFRSCRQAQIPCCPDKRSTEDYFISCSSFPLLEIIYKKIPNFK